MPYIIYPDGTEYHFGPSYKRTDIGSTSRVVYERIKSHNHQPLVIDVDLFGIVTMYYKSPDPMELEKESEQIDGFFDDKKFYNFKDNIMVGS